MRNTHELEALAVYLQNYDEMKPDSYHFDMSQWEIAVGCGTAACAIGHLKFAYPTTGLDIIDGKPTHNGKTEYDAIAEYFAMSRASAYLIFSPDYYFDNDTPQNVAKRITDYVWNHEYVAMLKDDVNAWNQWRMDSDASPNLIKANLNGADLRWANLNGADLRWANLDRANLRKADLSGADLRNANLSSAYLSGANLSEADLQFATLDRANLRKADLSGADLRNANLSRAYLIGADLSGADLRNADTRGATLPT